jgi:hypothetical protein
MQHATIDNLKEIYRAFQQYKEIFPFKRQDKLKREIEKGQVIWQDGVVIVYQQYKKATDVGSVKIPRGSIMLHQILNSNQFSGKGGKVFDQFVREIVKPSGGDVYLSVRESNAVARDFYERHGMKVVGKVSWSQGTLPGLVYRLTPNGE